jgi:hypothetical protein
MLRAGMVTSVRKGKFVVYGLADHAVLELLSSLRLIAERNSVEVEKLVRNYFDKLDALEPVTRKELVRRLRSGGVMVLDLRPEDEFRLAGLRNMRASLKPGGIMTMVVWRGITDNPWLGHAKNIVLEFLPPPGESAQTCGPGPFSMADTGVVTKQLEIAGYKDIQFEQVDAQVFVGEDLEDAAAFQLAIGPAGEVYREAGKLAEERHDEIANALKSALGKYRRSNGVMMDSSSWKVTARNPS